MSNLPISQAPSHSFNPIFAARYGIEEAIFIHHFQFWINHNQELGRNFKDGRTWTYQTRKEMAAWFPYLTPDQVRRITDSLVEKGVLIKGNYNKSPLDKTIWYAFKNEKIFTIGKIAKWTGKIAKAIPDTKPYTKNTTTPTSSSKKKLEKPKSPDSKVVVSSLDKLKISEKRKLSLLKKHPIDEIDKAVERVLNWTSRKNDEAAILTALREKDTWNDQVSIEDQTKENLQYLEKYRRLDNTKIGEYTVSVSYKYISFSYGRFYKEFSVIDKNFLEDLENFLKKITGKKIIELLKTTQNQREGIKDWQKRKKK